MRSLESSIYIHCIHYYFLLVVVAFTSLLMLLADHNNDSLRWINHWSHCRHNSSNIQHHYIISRRFNPRHSTDSVHINILYEMGSLPDQNRWHRIDQYRHHHHQSMPTIPLSSTDSSPPDVVNIQSTPTTFEFIIIETMGWRMKIWVQSRVDFNQICWGGGGWDGVVVCHVVGGGDVRWVGLFWWCCWRYLLAVADAMVGMDVRCQMSDFFQIFN